MHSSRGALGGNYEVPIDLKSERKQVEFHDVSSELGLYDTSNLTEYQVKAIQNRVTLKKLERQLSTSIERQQYYQYKPFFRSDPQRIHFLTLSSYEQRERYARSKGINPTNDQLTERDVAAIEESDLYIGMSKAGVQKSWGDPDRREIAGSAIYGNERWMYSDYVASPDGYVLEKKLIYFEGGRVVGWQKR
jgi:hypothetical protein